MALSESPARERLLDSAARLFYAEGIHATGVDRVLDDAQVTRATLYRHFRGKDALIVAYLKQADEAFRAAVDEIREKSPGGDESVRGVGRLIIRDIERPGFRGCAFLNAAAEYPDQDHPVRQAVLEQRTWLLATMTEMFTSVGKKRPEAVAQHFVMLRDGAMAAGCLSVPESICETFLLGVDGLLIFRGHGRLRAP